MGCVSWTLTTFWPQSYLHPQTSLLSDTFFKDDNFCRLTADSYSRDSDGVGVCQGKGGSSTWHSIRGPLKIFLVHSIECRYKIRACTTTCYPVESVPPVKKKEFTRPPVRLTNLDIVEMSGWLLQVSRVKGLIRSLTQHWSVLQHTVVLQNKKFRS